MTLYGLGGQFVIRGGQRCFNCNYSPLHTVSLTPLCSGLAANPVETDHDIVAPHIQVTVREPDRSSMQEEFETMKECVPDASLVEVGV